MKKFSMLMAFVFAVIFSSTAFAATWEQVASVDESGMKIKYFSTRYFAYLDSMDTENKFEADSDKDVVIDTIEVNDGKEMWVKIWDFVQKNSK